MAFPILEFSETLAGRDVISHRKDGLIFLGEEACRTNTGWLPVSESVTNWNPATLQLWLLWYLRRNSPKHVLLRQGFGGLPLNIPPRLQPTPSKYPQRRRSGSRGFLRRRVNSCLESIYVLTHDTQKNPVISDSP